MHHTSSCWPCDCGLCPADGRSMPAVLAAATARRWLARSAAGVKLVCNQYAAAAPACTSLICCLPSLETVPLRVTAPLAINDLGGLLEALAWCPRLRALSLYMRKPESHWPNEHLHAPFPAPALAHLSSLTSLALQFDELDPYTLADVVGALVSIRGLAELRVGFPKPAAAVMPAALGSSRGCACWSFTAYALPALRRAASACQTCRAWPSWSASFLVQRRYRHLAPFSASRRWKSQKARGRSCLTVSWCSSLDCSVWSCRETCHQFLMGHMSQNR